MRRIGLSFFNLHSKTVLQILATVFLSFGSTLAFADSGMLGIILAEHSPAAAKKYGFKKKVVFAKAVLAGSAAAKSGLMENDIIVKFGKSEIENVAMLQKLAGATSPGDKVSVEVQRSGKSQKIAIVMGSRKEFEEQSVNSLREKKAPDLAGIEIKTDVTVKLQDYIGKPVILKIWATWCPSCKAAIPVLNKMQADYKKQKLVILAVSTEKMSVLKKFKGKVKMQYTSIKANEMSLNRSYWVNAVPTFLLVDQKGVVRDIGLGMQGLMQVEKTLKRL